MNYNRKAAVRLVLGLEAKRTVNALVRQRAVAELSRDFPEITKALSLLKAQKVVTTRALEKVCRNSTPILMEKGIIQSVGRNLWKILPFD